LNTIHDDGNITFCFSWCCLLLSRSKVFLSFFGLFLFPSSTSWNVFVIADSLEVVRLFVVELPQLHFSLLVYLCEDGGGFMFQRITQEAL